MKKARENYQEKVNSNPNHTYYRQFELSLKNLTLNEYDERKKDTKSVHR
ncbi:hypothetical protein [Tunicatimonas pelagia]|nr:hypothetical protein [Tunicatimonas pelagia]WKN43149.1 hypothetical protein P0M28_29340 [Tunicatimonas pelagia]